MNIPHNKMTFRLQCETDLVQLRYEQTQHRRACYRPDRPGLRRLDPLHRTHAISWIDQRISCQIGLPPDHPEFKLTHYRRSPRGGVPIRGRAGAGGGASWGRIGRIGHLSAWRVMTGTPRRLCNGRSEPNPAPWGASIAAPRGIGGAKAAAPRGCLTAEAGSRDTGRDPTGAGGLFPISRGPKFSEAGRWPPARNPPLSEAGPPRFRAGSWSGPQGPFLLSSPRGRPAERDGGAFGFREDGHR